MRLTTIASVALLALSSAALAQVASSPVEQKSEPSNVAAPNKDEDALGNGASAGVGNVATANGTDDTAPAPRTTPTPRRRR